MQRFEELLYTALGIAHRWVLVKQTDNTSLIQTFENEGRNPSNELLYLQAPNQPGVAAAPTLQRRNETNDLQSWELVPVSSDPNTYGLRPKSFPDYALGLPRNATGNVTLNVALVTNRSWGKPTFHHYWRLSEPLANAK